MTFDENSPRNHNTPYLVHASVVLSKVLSKGIVGEKNALMTLSGNFEKLFGRQLAAHLEIADLQGGILVLKAASSVWKTEASYQKKAIIERCNGLLGKAIVRSVRFL
jgi:hypothetical protein